MSIFQFYQFQFNNENYQLSKNNIRVSIRPKTALVLSFLIENRHEIVNKTALFEAVWQTEHVQNHTLFQVISELRKLSPEELIRTQPNRGYQWLAPTTVIEKVDSASVTENKRSAIMMAFKKSKTKYLTIAASITALTCTSFFLGQWSSNISSPIAQSAHSMPAVNAYTKGILAFDQGQYSQAQQWFNFSLLEDPSAAQTKLMLAESLFQQKSLIEAQSIAFELLDSIDKSAYHYSSTADLLSRIYAQQGLVFDALAYAINGANSLQNSNAFCSIEVSEQRIEKLAQQLVGDKNLQLNKDKLLAGYYKQIRNSGQTPAGNQDKLTDYDTLCEKINVQVENKQTFVEDTSACLKSDSTEWLISYNNFQHNHRKA